MPADSWILGAMGWPCGSSSKSIKTRPSSPRRADKRGYRISGTVSRRGSVDALEQPKTADRGKTVMIHMDAATTAVIVDTRRRIKRRPAFGCPEEYWRFT